MLPQHRGWQQFGGGLLIRVLLLLLQQLSAGEFFALQPSGCACDALHCSQLASRLVLHGQASAGAAGALLGDPVGHSPWNKANNPQTLASFITMQKC